MLFGNQSWKEEKGGNVMVRCRAAFVFVADAMGSFNRKANLVYLIIALLEKI